MIAWLPGTATTLRGRRVRDKPLRRRFQRAKLVWFRQPRKTFHRRMRRKDRHKG